MLFAACACRNSELTRISPMVRSRSVSVQGMNLISRDEKTGRIREAGKKRDMEAFGVSFSVTMLLVMIVMMTSGPMLPAIAEDKMQRVFEMLLASATPFELIAGKVLAALGRSLTSAVVYIAGAILLLNSLAMMGMAPIELLPWFVIYLITEVVTLGAPPPLSARRAAALRMRKAWVSSCSRR